MARSLSSVERSLYNAAVAHNAYASSRAHVLKGLHPTPLPTHADAEKLEMGVAILKKWRTRVVGEEGGFERLDGVTDKGDMRVENSGVLEVGSKKRTYVADCCS